MPTRTVEEFPERVQLEALGGHPSAAVGVTVASGFVVKQGDVIGKITSSAKYRRRTHATVNTTAFATNSPTGKVLDAGVFKAGDVLTDADGDNVGTVQSIDLTTTPHTITLTGNAATAVAAGADVLGSDGSQVAKAVADQETDGTADTTIAALISGKLVESKLRGLDASAKSELAGASVAGDIFKF